MNFRLNRLLIIMIGVGVSNSIESGQVSKEGTPYSFKYSVRSDYETVTMPEEVDVDFLLMEDKIAGKDDPLRFGYPFYVEYNLENSGSWETTEDGGKIWRLGIISEGAYSINIVYDDYWIPPGGELYIYNLDYFYILIIELSYLIYILT